MAVGPPLSHLLLSASSIADDLGYVALADLAKIIGGAGDTSDHRIIGGHMITALAARWMLGADLYRETGDADLGITPVLVRSLHLPDKLKALGYEQAAGNRFARTMRDIPVTLTGAQATAPQALIDILVPAYTGRARQNVEITEDLITTEVPGLAAALGRSAVIMTLELRRLNGETLLATLPFPDEVSALVLKALATRVRAKATDATDIWRCLEIALAAGVVPQDFSRSGRAEAATIIRTLSFREPDPRSEPAPAGIGWSGAGRRAGVRRLVAWPAGTRRARRHRRLRPGRMCWSAGRRAAATRSAGPPGRPARRGSGSGR